MAMFCCNVPIKSYVTVNSNYLMECITYSFVNVTRIYIWDFRCMCAKLTQSPWKLLYSVPLMTCSLTPLEHLFWMQKASICFFIQYKLEPLCFHPSTLFSLYTCRLWRWKFKQGVRSYTTCRDYTNGQMADRV